MAKSLSQSRSFLRSKIVLFMIINFTQTYLWKTSQNDRFDKAGVRFYKLERLKYHLNLHPDRKKTD